MFDSSEQLSVMYAMHRGYVYFVHGESPMKESTATLYRAKLGDTSDTAPEAIYTFSGIGATIFGLSAYGNNLFFMAADYEDEKGNGYKTTLHYMDIHTLETNQIPEREFSHTADAGKVYYGKDEKTIECYDLKTKKIKVLIKKLKISAVYGIDSKKVIYSMYDKQGESQYYSYNYKTGKRRKITRESI